MMPEQIGLIEPSEDFKEEYLGIIEEFRKANEKLGNAGIAQQDFTAFILKLYNQSKGLDLPPGFVPATTFWLIRDNRVVLGESRLRHYLKPPLEEFGGHIGYFIRPSQRRKGYGTLILALTLDKVHAMGIQRARVTCDTDNIGSARVIERNGGILSGHGVSPINGKQTSQYWIEL
jgi:predicted acetyltransferase